MSHQQSEQRLSELLSLHEQLRQERKHYEQLWQSIAERVAPSRANFNEHRSMTDEALYKGRARTDHIYDATPALALQRFSAAMASLATPKNQLWHDIKAVDENLAEDLDICEYTDTLRNRLFSARYSANFDVATQECYTDAGCFGNACMFIGEKLGRSLYYKHVPLEQAYWSINDYGDVDWVDREFAMTARQAFMRFGEKLPAHIVQAAKNKPNQKFWFLHIVRPRENVDPQRADHRAMAYESIYISFSGRKIINEGGFRTMPYSILRFSGDGSYGEGPCALILPDIKMLNVMNRDLMQAAELAVMPPMLAAEDGIFSAGFSLTPGAINYGGIERQSGRQLAIPMQLGGSLPIGLEMMSQKRQLINDALWNTLFQVLVDSPQMTATEAMLRAQEKGALLAPAAARVESEFLEPTIIRELDLLDAHGDLPEMPEELEQAGGQYAIEYTNPLARYRKSEDGVAVMRAIEQLGVLAQVAGPEVMMRVNFDEAAKLLMKVNGVPAAIIRSDDEMQEMLEQQQAMEQQMQEQAAMQEMMQQASPEQAQQAQQAQEIMAQDPQLMAQLEQVLGGQAQESTPEQEPLAPDNVM